MKKFWRVKASVHLTNERSTLVTFYACRRIANPNGTVTFVRCSASGESDADSIDAGNGGSIQIFVLKLADIIWEKEARMNNKYGTLRIATDA